MDKARCNISLNFTNLYNSIFCCLLEMTRVGKDPIGTEEDEDFNVGVQAYAPFEENKRKKQEKANTVKEKNDIKLKVEQLVKNKKHINSSKRLEASYLA